MEDSLLISLRNYRARSGRDSLEDFVTEAFAWLLRNSLPAHRAFINLLAQRIGLRRGHPLYASEPSWETQSSLDAKRVDMALINERMALLVEHKVGSMLSHGQLRTYRELGEDHFPDHDVLLALVTANSGQRPASETADADVCLLWSEISQAFTDALTLNSDLADLDRVRIADFVELLKHEGLGPAEPVSLQAVQYFPTTVALPEELKSLFSQVQHRFDWPLANRYTVASRGMRWGRVGLEFTLIDEKLDWGPGLFLGTVLDGRDHCIQHRTGEHLKLQVILDFSRKLHRYYPTSPSYQQLSSSLQRYASENSTAFDFYDHLADSSRGTNKYHPLYLEAPLFDVLRRTESAAEQQQRVIDFGNSALQQVCEAGLGPLADECLAQV